MIRHIKDELTLPVFAYFGFLVLSSVLPVFLGDEIPGNAASFGKVISWFCISWWLLDDARRKGITLPMVYGNLTLFAFPFFLPFYLFKTRGRRGLISFVIFLSAIIFIIAINVLVYFCGF